MVTPEEYLQWGWPIVIDNDTSTYSISQLPAPALNMAGWILVVLCLLLLTTTTAASLASMRPSQIALLTPLIVSSETTWTPNCETIPKITNTTDRHGDRPRPTNQLFYSNYALSTTPLCAKSTLCGSGRFGHLLLLDVEPLFPLLFPGVVTQTPDLTLLLCDRWLLFRIRALAL